MLHGGTMKIDEYVKYELTEKEIEIFLSADYGINSKSGNKTVGKMIIKVIDSFEIKKERHTFYAQRVKNLAVQNIAKNKRYAFSTRVEMASNYVHQMMMYEINMFLFYRNNPNYVRN
jgi:hypothetical protein